MGALWLYTILRFTLFVVIWGLLYLCGLGGFLSAIIALLLSLPLSYVLLARPRALLSATIEQRLQARAVRRSELDSELDGNAD
jgi:hypothetical protein